MEWACSECTYINSGHWRMCQMCGTSRTDYRTTPVQRSMQGSSWNCSECTYINYGDRTACKMCGCPSVVQTTSSYQQTPQPPVSDSSPQPKPPCPGWSASVSPSNERRLVVLGRTGSGKSTTCNNILGSVVFKSDTCGQSVTVHCQRATCDRFGRNIQIIDTPGLFDTGMTNAETTREIVKCVGMTAPGPHAFVMIIRIDRFTKEEQDTVEHFKNVFGPGMMKYLLVLFTRKDDLIHNGKTIQQYLQSVPAPLRELLQSCGNRYIAFNNRGTPDERDRDVQDLMNQVDSIFLNNGGQCYTSDMYKEAEKAMLKREEQMRKAHESKVNREKLIIQQECEKKIQEMQRVQEETIARLKEEVRVKEHDKEKQHEIERMKLELEREKIKMEKELELERRRAEIEAEKRKDELEKIQSSYREEARQEVNKGEETALEMLKYVSQLILPHLVNFGVEMMKDSWSSGPKSNTPDIKVSKTPDINPTDDEKQTEEKAKSATDSSVD